MKNFFSRYKKDYYGGSLIILIGLGVALQGVKYKMGSLTRMGSGFFPVTLGVLMALTGLAIVLCAKNAAPSSEARKKPLAPEWRGWICITAGIAAFVILGRYGGLVPATFAVVFISAMGDRQNTVRQASILSLSMVLVGIGIFWWALRLPFPLFRWG
ncbi:MAG TPA: tripartite tricarboxylate transporter TctB family protein [Herbaspirillum sp.]|jgi:hypothetical protein